MKKPPSQFWFLAPALLLYGVFVLLPVGESLVFSTLHWEGYGPAKFIWLGNYLELLQDPVFYQALGHNFLLALASVVGQIPLALGLALAFHGRGRLAHCLRALVFSPMILPSAVIAIMFTLLYNFHEGPLLALLSRLHGPKLQFLEEPLVLPSLIVAISWRYIGFHMMLILAALQGIDPVYYEAAAIDGAGPWQRFVHITLPGIAPTLMLSVLLAVLGSLKYFDLVYIMTRGGPNHASELLTTFLFQQGNSEQRLGYASAIAVALLAVSLACGVLVQLARARRSA